MNEPVRRPPSRPEEAADGSVPLEYDLYGGGRGLYGSGRGGTEAEREDPPPSLIEDPSLLHPMASGLHTSLLGTAAQSGTIEAWQSLVAELADESRHVEDPTLRAAMLCEAGRVLIEKLGRQEEGELLLRSGDGAIAEVLRKAAQTGTSGLAAELAALEATARDGAQEAATRAAAWVEFGQLCEERTPSKRRAFDAYREALALVKDHPIALSLAIELAIQLNEHAFAADAVRAALGRTKSSRHRVALLLDLAEHTADADEKLVLLEQAHQAEPREETALRRYIRALSSTDDHDHLGELYRELARVSVDPISSSTALHLAFLTLAEAGRPVADLVVELAARAPERPDSTDILAPLSEVALHVEQRIAAGDDAAGLPENMSVLDRLRRCLDDPREQALVREQLARLRLARVRELAAEQEPGARLGEQAAALADRAGDDLRFCLVHMPEHRWIREALAELLRLQGNLPALVLHLQEWARTQTAGPGRASILLQLGQVHERDRRDLARAAEVYELAVAEDPENPSCLRALGHIYEKMRRWPQAVAALRRQADQTDDETERLAALRRVAVMSENELGDVDLAIASLEEIAKHAPEDLLSLYQLVKLCRAHRRTGVLIGALELLVARVDDDVARTALLVELGEVQELSLKQRQGARACYERALALTPGYTPALRALSRLYRDNGQLDELVRLFDPKVDTVTDPAVLALKAARVCFEEIGDIDRAIDQLWTAYRGNPDLVPARELLMQLLTASGRIEEAYDLLRAQDPPRSPPAAADYHYRLGLLAEASSRQHDANAMPRKDGALRHEDAALQHYRAALVQQADHGLAQERSRRLLVAHHDVANLARMLDGTAPDGLALRSLQLARIHIAEQAGLATARRAYEAAYEAAPDDPIIRRELEGLLRLLGDKKSLPALYLRAARETKDTHLQATLLVEAAEMLLLSGAREDYELAGNAILDALRVDPGSPYAVRHLERLLSDPDSPFVIKDAVSARAVRAQSDAERAIFYLESAELLEKVGAWGQARRAYLAAKGALPQLAPADLGLNRLVSDNRRAAAAAQQKASIHVLLAEARDAVVRATRGDAVAAARALELLGEILQRDPQSRDAVALARALAGQVADPAPIVQLLASVFARVEAPELRYEIALFLGDRAATPEHAVRYFDAATRARPDGRRALRGLIGAYRQLGDDRRAAAATERLLELFDPTEPSAIDLRMGVAAFLAASPETLPRALDHARMVLEVRADDPRAMQLMADLLERAGKREEAASVLDRLAARERGRERLHDIHLRRAKLLADLPGREREALDAIERAAAINPGNRETVALFVEQLHRTGQSARIATYLPPIRSAVVTNIGRGALSIRDLRLLARVAEVASPPLCRVATAMGDALEPPSDRPRVRQAVSEESLKLVLDTTSLRNALLAEGEPAALHALVGAVEGVVARLIREFPVVGPLDVAQVPKNVDVADATESARRYGEVLGLKPPRLLGSNTHNTVMLLQDVVPSVRLGLNLWNQADPPALRGLVAVAIARFGFGAPRARALPPAALDLLLAASFEAVEVFNPMTGDHDAKRLAELVTQLRTVLPRRQRKIVEDSCRALASYAFDAGATARAMRTSDLRLAAVLSADPGSSLAAACLLDGVVGGSLKERINRSRSAQELVVWLLGDDGLAVQAAATAPDTSAGA